MNYDFGHIVSARLLVHEMRTDHDVYLLGLRTDQAMRRRQNPVGANNRGATKVACRHYTSQRHLVRKLMRFSRLAANNAMAIVDFQKPWQRHRTVDGDQQQQERSNRRHAESITNVTNSKQSIYYILKIIAARHNIWTIETNLIV